MRLMSPFELKIKLDLADDRKAMAESLSVMKLTAKSPHGIDFFYGVLTAGGHIVVLDSRFNGVNAAKQQLHDFRLRIGSGSLNLKLLRGPFYVPDVKIIPDFALGNSDFDEVWIPETVKTIGSLAFAGCFNLAAVHIAKARRIERQAFESCHHLREIAIPDSVKSIGAYAFAECWSLERAVISRRIESIGSRAFCSASRLKEVLFKDKTLQQVREMSGFPWGIDVKAIKAERS